MAQPLQSAFTAGELSPGLYARTDLATYYKGLKTCKNWFVRFTGGISNRPGTQYVAEVKTSANPTYLIPFRFSRSVSYVLEFGNNYMRVVKNGAQILSAGVPYEITSPFTTADLPDVRYVQSADVMTLTHPTKGIYQVARTGDTAWTISLYFPTDGPYQDINTDKTVTVTVNATSGNVTLTASSSIFNANHVGSLFYVEAEDLQDVVPWEADKQIAAPGASPNGKIRRNSVGDVYKCVTTTVAGTQEIRTGTVEPTHKTGIASDGDGSPITNTASTVLAEVAGVAWEYMYSFYGRMRITSYISGTSVKADALGTLPSEIKSATAGTVVLAAGVGDGLTTVFTLTGATSDVSSDYTVRITTTYTDAETGFTFTTHSTAAPSTYTVDHTAGTITFDSAPADNSTITVTETGSTGSVTSLWAFGAWSTDAGYPSTVTYIGDRLTFGGTSKQPQTVWMGKTGDYSSFAQSFPTAADDAITFTLNAREINPINELLPADFLLMLTEGAEWRMTTGQTELITPYTIGARTQSNYGADNQRGEMIDDAAVYVAAQGGHIRGMRMDMYSGRYVSQDLSIQADHLFEGYTVSSLAYHRSPYRMLWAVRSDGELLSFTYVPEQQVVAWAHHATGEAAGDVFEQTVVVPESGEDFLYVIVKRTINGQTKRYIERMHTRRVSSDCSDAWFVDAGLSYDGTNTDSGKTMELTGSDWTVNGTLTLTAAGHTPFSAANVNDEVVLTSGADSVRVKIIAYTSTSVVTVVPEKDVPASLQAVATSSWVFRKLTMSGLNHLEGRVVSVLADGNVQLQKTVTAGTIALDSPGGKVIVGLPIENANVETLSVNFAGAESLSDKVKNIPKVSLIVRDTRALYVGESSTSTLDTAKARSTENYDDPALLQTGNMQIPINSTWNKSGSVFITQKDPLPATILGILPTVAVGGSGV